MENKKLCCICKKEFVEYGNNPYGALNAHNEVIKWQKTDVCCDKCNNEKVIPGRIYLMCVNKDKRKENE